MFLVTSKQPLFLPFNFTLRFPRLLLHNQEMEFVRKLGRKFCVVESKKKNQKLKVIEYDNDLVNAEDVFDYVSAESKIPPDHLVIMVNGIIGRYFCQPIFFFY